jgi:hypothetical protein
LTFQLIKVGIIAWLSEANPTWETDEGVLPKLRESVVAKAIMDQFKIGWEAALKGYLSVEWRHIASFGIQGEELQDGSGLQAIKTILKAFHEFTQSIWKARNNVLHKSQDMDMKKISQAEITEIIELYGNPELVPAGDRHQCEQPLRNLIARAPATRRRWLRYMRAARLRYTKDGVRQTKITQYFMTSSTSD